jgi:hypothetical protein
MANIFLDLFDILLQEYKALGHATNGGNRLL